MLYRKALGLFWFIFCPQCFKHRDYLLVGKEERKETKEGEGDTQPILMRNFKLGGRGITNLGLILVLQSLCQKVFSSFQKFSSQSPIVDVEPDASP